MARKKNSKIENNWGKKFGQRVKSERKNMKLSQNDLARKAKVSPEMIRSIEGGKTGSPGLFLSYKLVKNLRGNLNKWVQDIVKNS